MIPDATINLGNVPEEFFALLAVAILSIGLPLSIAFARRLARAPRDPSPDALAAIDARLSRLEHAVEAVALEIERQGEHLRFQAQLAEKTPPSLNAP